VAVLIERFWSAPWTQRALAAWFTAGDAPLAIKAANQRGLRYLDLTDDERREIATHLPQGRMFQSGRVMVPIAVSLSTTERWAALLP
jgi:hypothetical protein